MAANALSLTAEPVVIGNPQKYPYICAAFP
jgi:hypothetical protein